MTKYNFEQWVVGTRVSRVFPRIGKLFGTVDEYYPYENGNPWIHILYDNGDKESATQATFMEIGTKKESI